MESSQVRKTADVVDGKAQSRIEASDKAMQLYHATHPSLIMYLSGAGRRRRRPASARRRSVEVPSQNDRYQYDQLRHIGHCKTSFSVFSIKLQQSNSSRQFNFKNLIFKWWNRRKLRSIVDRSILVCLRIIEIIGKIERAKEVNYSDQQIPGLRPGSIRRDGGGTGLSSYLNRKLYSLT